MSTPPNWVDPDRISTPPDIDEYDDEVDADDFYDWDFYRDLELEKD